MCGCAAPNWVLRAKACSLSARCTSNAQPVSCPNLQPQPAGMRTRTRASGQRGVSHPPQAERVRRIGWFIVMDRAKRPPQIPHGRAHGFQPGPVFPAQRSIGIPGVSHEGCLPATAYAGAFSVAAGKSNIRRDQVYILGFTLRRIYAAR